MTSLICARPIPPVHARGARVLCATAVPDTVSIVAATDAPELVYTEEHRVSIVAFARAVACVRYTSVAPNALPEQKPLVLALVNGIGLNLFSFPALDKIQGPLADELQNMSRTAHIFSVDNLGSDLVAESFRVALAKEFTVQLLNINPVRETVTTLGHYTLPDRVMAVAFSEMTIVASTSAVHYLLRISKGGVLAVAATVFRTQYARQKSKAADGGVAMFSFFGGFFGRRGLASNIPLPMAYALPDNKWLLTVDHELVTYSSFGQKIDDMENVFKSKTGLDVAEPTMDIRNEKDGGSSQANRKSYKSESISSFTSHATGISHRTFLDETMANRVDRPPLSTTFSSPFVLSVTTKNEIIMFAANGSVQGVMEQTSLIDNEQTKPEFGVRIVTCRHNRTLAIAYWPSGRICAIDLVEDLDTLIEQKESEQELRLALALVPADQTSRMLSLRRALAVEARSQEWHDAAIHHMQHIVNIVVKSEGTDADLIAESVELRGSSDGSWQADDVTATLWSDFLFRLRRQIMRPSKADIDVLETLCRTDESASRVRSLVQSQHGIPLAVGENQITSKQSILRPEERIDALVALYTSLSAHEKSLTLLESSENKKNNNSLDGVIRYLSTAMHPSDDPDVFFDHLKWVAREAANEAQGRPKLQKLIRKVVKEVKDSDFLLGKTLTVLVEEADGILSDVVDEIFVFASQRESEAGYQTRDNNFSKREHISEDVIALALLEGMAKANAIEKKAVFDILRSFFRSKILYRDEATFHSYTLLQALQKPEYCTLGLREELAYLLGRQGRLEAAADELAAEITLGPEQALARLMRMSPTSDRGSAVESLVAAYLRVSVQGRAMRIKDASNIVRSNCGTLDIEKLLLDGCCSDDALTLTQMYPYLEAALVSGSERYRLGEILRALRKSEARRMREEVLTRRRRVVVIGPDRACTLCTRRISTHVFVAYPDGSVAHYACHVSRDNQDKNDV